MPRTLTAYKPIGRRSFGRLKKQWKDQQKKQQRKTNSLIRVIRKRRVLKLRTIMNDL